MQGVIPVPSLWGEKDEKHETSKFSAVILRDVSDFGGANLNID